jgi:glycosyltransferase involved in cell wall biosynthesis
MSAAPIRICFINTTRFWGGGEKWHFETATYLAQRGHHVFGIVHPGGELHRRLAETPVTPIPMAITNFSLLNPFKFWKLRAVLRRNAIRTVVFNGSAEVKLGAPAARSAGVPAIVYRRGLDLPVKNSVANRILYGRLITHFIANSEATARTLFMNLCVPGAAAKTRIIYNGIDIPRYQNALEQRAARVEETVVIGTAGRLEPQKGHLHLLEMAAHLRQRQINFRLLIAGEGHQRAILEKRIAELGLAERVLLLGFVADMPGFLRKLDIFVFPSLWEGFGYAAAEAMSAGLPVVAYDLSSNREIIDPDHSGFLVPAEDIAALAEKTAQLTERPELRQRMGQKGLARVRAYFDQEEQRRKLEHYLCWEVLAG